MSLLILLVFSFSAYAGPAKTVYSKSVPSSWTTGANWSSTSGGGTCSCTPDETKDVIYVETNTNSAVGLVFGASVTLTIRNNSTLTINGDASFPNGAIINVEAGSTLVITGNLVNNNNSNQITINGSLSVGGNFTGGNGSTVSGAGTMAVTGTATTTGSGTVFGSNGSCSGCVISTASPLPVEFLSLDAVADGNVVNINWSTAVEMNSDYFVVQRSQGGSFFEDVVKVNAAGNSSTIKNYTSTDNEPFRGTSYYRLKQFDLDGKFAFSDIVSVKVQGRTAVVVFPNPSSKGAPFNVCVQANPEDHVLIVVRDLQGKEYYSKVVITSNDKEVIAFDPEGRLAAGVYLVIATSNDSIYEKKMVIR